MSVIKLDKNLKPVLTAGKNFETVDGAEAFEQWVRLQAKDRLYTVLQEYNSQDIPSKIRLTINRIAEESDLIDSVEKIEIEELPSISGYQVDISYDGSEQYTLLLET